MIHLDAAPRSFQLAGDSRTSCSFPVELCEATNGRLLFTQLHSPSPSPRHARSLQLDHTRTVQCTIFGSSTPGQLIELAAKANLDHPLHCMCLQTHESHHVLLLHSRLCQALRAEILDVPEPQGQGSEMNATTLTAATLREFPTIDVARARRIHIIPVSPRLDLLSFPSNS